MTSRKVHQRRVVYQDFFSPESLCQHICMLLLCSYVQNSDFPRADQSPDEMEFHVNVLAPRRATWIIRDHFCALVIAINIYSHATQLRLEENQNRSFEKETITFAQYVGFGRVLKDTRERCRIAAKNQWVQLPWNTRKLLAGGDSAPSSSTCGRSVI